MDSDTALKFWTPATVTLGFLWWILRTYVRDPLIKLEKRLTSIESLATLQAVQLDGHEKQDKTRFDALDQRIDDALRSAHA